MNLTLISLHISYLASTTSFLPVSSSYSSPINLFTFSHLHFDHHFSSLFRIDKVGASNSKLGFSLDSSKMAHFLNQVISISQRDDVPSGHRGSYGQPSLSPTDSFNITRSDFENNEIPLELPSGMAKSTSGAAIYVSVPYSISANITYCNFTNNKAPFGGAIYYGSTNGELLLSNSQFISNSCFGQGAHMFIGEHGTLDLGNLNFILGTGDSNLLIIGKENEDLELSEIRYYQNAGPVTIQNAKTATFTGCCFTRFKGSGNDLEYLFDNLISNEQSNVQYTISQACVNYHFISDPISGSAQEINDKFKEMTEINESQCYQCRLVPTPSHTMSARVQLTCAKEAIIAICCCVFISILGIIIVVALNKTKYAESTDHSN